MNIQTNIQRDFICYNNQVVFNLQFRYPIKLSIITRKDSYLQFFFNVGLELKYQFN
ncbi:unnamed protein product [Paramecium sonneborni]|uniref:Uncharacterized protein n=1 Tax=Paramecium sonneborni TaxID=65129 RepID=A0A8S1RSE5_9CILI|nr:unnamed protein product [Paramecium sonneborni]